MKSVKRNQAPRNWVAQAMQSSQALDLERGIFTQNNPRRIALSLKIAAERSDRRKSAPFRSAMSMLTFYINRAGRKLSPNQRQTLEEAKRELRKIFSAQHPAQRHAISRFHVMAVLQAARAQALGLDTDESKSWGLNRALFYRAAKQGWQRAKQEGARYPIILEFEQSKKKHDPVYVLGGEKAFRARDYTHGLRFKFGYVVQYPEQFDLQIKDKFGKDWILVWKQAVQIIQNSHRRDLDIRSRFFHRVYQPHRDVLVEQWSALGLNIQEKPTIANEKGEKFKKQAA